MLAACNSTRVSILVRPAWVELSKAVGREQEIEDRIVANLGWFGYAGASWTRRAKMGREGFGSVDLMLLPKTGPHRLVLIEVKHQDSYDTPGRLVGQLLAYYLAALRFGSDGLK